jgi:flagellar hook-associated protein 2
MAGLVSISGLVSGMKTDEILAKILEAERRPVQRYEAQQQRLRDRISAYQEANTRLAAVKEAAATLATASFYQSRSVTSSHTDLVTATAETGATPGDYLLTVEKMARAHQVLSQSYSDINAIPVGTGSLTITAGGKSIQITVDASNNTLAGLRDAINNAGGNVRASIVQDSDSSYRLMIASKETGTANAMTIQSTLAGGTTPAFTDLQAAVDARVKLGSGATAITITRGSNTIRDLIPGVTLMLAREDAANPVTVSVSEDTAQIKEAIQKFVDQYNKAIDYFNKQFAYNPDTDQGGTLNGDRALRQVQSELYQVVTGSVAGVSQGSLADIGLTMGSEGKLSLDLSTLSQKLADDPASVARVLALTSESTHTGIQLLSVGGATAVDGTAYEVELFQAPRQARVTAGTAMNGALAADETLTINDVEIALTTGMTRAQVVAAINARARETGVRVSATDASGTGAGNYLTFKSVAYGASAEVSIVSSRSSASGNATGVGNVVATASNPSGESGGTGEEGLDVVGTINGESASGAGQVLTGEADNPTTAGLKLRIAAGTTGVLGTLRLFNGIAHQAEATLNAITNMADGRIKGEEDSIQERIDDLQRVIDARQETIRRREEQIRRQFNAMEEAMARFQNQASILTSQLGQR